MNHIHNNPYRILGLPITASEREIAKQINMLSTYAEMGKSKTYETDFPFLESIDRTPHLIEEAKKQIEQSESKFLYSLFWFWKNNSVDELALEVLKEGNTNKAIEIWGKSVFANKHKIYKSSILSENLISQKTSWPEEDNDNHSLHKNTHEYIVERKKAETSSIPCLFYDLDFEENWSIDCDTEWINGVDNESYGIVFGRDQGNYYFFGIAGSDSFMYCKYLDYLYTPYIEWKDTPKFNKWGSNHIQIKKIENQLTFYVNDILVGSYQAEPFFGKYFGFKVTKNQKISFRNFKFCKLIEDDIYGEGLNISSKNFSSIKNLSTLYLSLATNSGTIQLEYFKKGIALIKNFFTTENIEDYSKLIAGDRYIYNSENALHFYINDLIESLKKYIDKSGGISTKQLINIFSTFPVEATQFLNNKFVSKQIINIDKEIEKATLERRNSPATAAEIGKNLIRNTKTDIEYLKNILNVNDFQYQIIGDKLSLAIIQCGIDAFNICKDPKGEIDYINAIKGEEAYLHEYEYALSVAVTERTKERAKENLDSCKQYIEDKHYYYCWFCGNNPPEDTSKFEITIYKETSRSYFPRSVKYSYLPVTIPRCTECQKIHSNSSDKFTFILIGCALVGLIIGALADGFWLAGLLVGAGIGWVLGTILKDQQTSKEAIKGTNESTIRNYPVLNKLINEGWRFSKPTA